MAQDKTTNGERTKFQKFDVKEIERSLIKNAPYNPRRISAEARARLKVKISGIGLVNTLTWNRRTGNLVGGHQRLSILDELEGSQKYTLKVSVVDIAEREEKSLNVFLNNIATMGDWDTTALAAIAAEFKAEDMGFAPGELDYLIAPKAEDEADGGDGEDRPRRPTQNDQQVIVVCQTAADTDAFLSLIGASTSTRYVDGTEHFKQFGFGKSV